MREGTAALTLREDYKTPAFWIRSVELSFDLDAAKTIVASRMVVERNPDQPAQPLKLHGSGLKLLRVQADGDSVSFREEPDLLVIDNPPAAATFTLEIRNTLSPSTNSELSGLYASGGGLFSQCEAEGFRRITYFLDRPDVMAIYTVTLRAQKTKYPVLLSNGNLLEHGELDGGRHFAKWHDPFPKPSYLFALVAADLVAHEQKIRTRAGRDHLLQIYVKRADLGKTEHAMNSLIAAIAWDEARFGLSLDLERFMVVAVEDFNFGAMENKGLNLFNIKCVLASAQTATDGDFLGVESVVAHEYFHNWTGNRVTCRDWFQLSLKEGLTVFRDQEFSMDMAGSASSRAVKRIEDVLTLRAVQFPEDAGSMSHPVRPDSYVAIDNFYTPTIYEKGAEVVRMMHTLVGRDGFAAGMRLYFQRHDGQAVTCDDFAQALADANPASALAEHLHGFKHWYSQSGTPRLDATGHFDTATRTYTLTLSQRGAVQGQAPFVVPVRMALFSTDGKALPLRLAGEPTTTLHETLLVLSQREQQWTFIDIDAAPVPSLLRGFSAPVVLQDGLGDAELLTLMAHDTDPFNRWEAAQRLALKRLVGAVRDGGDAAFDDDHLQGLRTVLRQPGLDPAFKQRVLSLPDEGYVAEQLSTVDPQLVHSQREKLLLQLAAALHADWQWAYDSHQVGQGYQPTREQAGRRDLANLALEMLCRQGVAQADAVWPGRAYQRVKSAGNMSERIGALHALMQSRSPLADAALAHFHAQAQRDPLVLDKWFKLQAGANEACEVSPDRMGADGQAGGRSAGGAVLARARQLLKHADFSLRSPNRARALLVSLCRNNPAAFHRRDASGYVFWAERVIELDAINPSVAARLARAMDRVDQLVEPYRGAAREAIARVAARSDLSAEVREVVSRALRV